VKAKAGFGQTLSVVAERERERERERESLSVER
jgi:hypothetical protein